jgi:hypothetical protein
MSHFIEQVAFVAQRMCSSHSAQHGPPSGGFAGVISTGIAGRARQGELHTVRAVKRRCGCESARTSTGMSRAEQGRCLHLQRVEH